MDMTTNSHAITNLLLLAAPSGSPTDQLAMLQGMGTPLSMLLQLSQTLHTELGEALMAIPAPLGGILPLMPSEAVERALLGFTITEVLDHPEVMASTAHRGHWEQTPRSLQGLIDQEHVLVHQVIYTGLVLFLADSPSRWGQVLEVMRRANSPAAMAPHYAPVTPSMSRTYDTVPLDVHCHPFIFFCRNPIA
jgi:hypothetical protein